MSKKRETVWRDKLVRLFKERNQKGFIWVNGSLFKQGFPDLTLVQGGVTTHVELKVAVPGREAFSEISPRQKIVMREIVKAGGRALCAELDPGRGTVRVLNFQTEMARAHPRLEFEMALWGWPGIDL